MGHYEGMDELLAEEAEERQKIVSRWTTAQYNKAKTMYIAYKLKREIFDLQRQLTQAKAYLKSNSKIKVDKKEVDTIGYNFNRSEFLHTYTKDYGRKK